MPSPFLNGLYFTRPSMLKNRRQREQQFRLQSLRRRGIKAIKAYLQALRGHRNAHRGL